jgi:hypothetical protein
MACYRRDKRAGFVSDHMLEVAECKGVGIVVGFRMERVA